MPSPQRQLFETEPDPWEADDDDLRLIASVVLPKGPASHFDYLVPDSVANQLQVGCRVEAPFGRGNRSVTGYCVALETRATGSRRLKEIHSVVDSHSLLSPAMIHLTRWMADYYLCPWGQVLEAVVPAGVRGKAGTRKTTVYSVPERVARSVDKLKLSAKQSQIIKTLVGSPRPLSGAQLAKLSGCTTGPINTLRKKGLLETRVESLQKFEGDQTTPERQSALALNEDQQAALDAILTSLRSSEHETVLMHGVTGSGKTEVYIQAIEEVVSYGRQAIVLVPEISLTPQTRERFRARFDSVAVLHSHLSDSERHWHWQRIAAGDVQVVVGARSAIFAPTPNLGLIVLDEEHESTFKQSTAPRYHARLVAQRRAAAEGVPLILGSATPSLESWRQTVTGESRLIELPRRVFNRPLPRVATIDLRVEAHNKHSRGAVSRQLHQAMEAALAAKGQVILLLNRRGFSTQIQCPACGRVVKCPDCEIALTHHRQDELAICHYCDHSAPAPVECPHCQFSGIRYSGLGTQRLEAEINRRFPNKTCLRMDTDSMRKPGSHEQALDRFRRGEVDILMGTQMIAKGLDFPNVTLVGVINADTALHLPDFRAAERTFHLVTQVAGRTGRGDQGGQVLVQTYSPEHPAIMAAVQHDFNAFAQYELPVRDALGYPPYATMVRLVIRGPSQPQTLEFAKTLAERLNTAAQTLTPEKDPANSEANGQMNPDANGKENSEEKSESITPEVRVLGPAPAPIEKLRGNFRFQIQTQSACGDFLRKVISHATQDLNAPAEVQWIVDVDPLEML